MGLNFDFPIAKASISSGQIRRGKVIFLFEKGLACHYQVGEAPTSLPGGRCRHPHPASRACSRALRRSPSAQSGPSDSLTAWKALADFRLDFLPAILDRATALFTTRPIAGKRHPMSLLLEREGLASISILDL